MSAVAGVMLHTTGNDTQQQHEKTSTVDKPTSRKVKRLLCESLSTLGTIVILVVMIQLLYPAERTLPFTKVADIEIGGLTKRDAIEYLFGTYSSAPLTVSVAGETIKTTTDKAGILVNFQKAADAAARYPLWQRLVPFSLFYKSFVINATPEIAIDKQVAEQFVKNVQQKCNKPVLDASVVVKVGEVVLQPGRDGSTCSDATVRQGLEAVLFRHKDAHVVIRGTKITPTKTTAIAQGQFDQAKAVVAGGLIVTVGNEKLAVPKETLASWIKFVDDPVKKTHTIGFDDTAIRNYLDTRKNAIFVAPTVTNIYITDGMETYREAGRAGNDVDYDVTIAAVKQALQDKRAKSVTAKAKAVDTPQQYIRSYSSTQRGMEVLLRDIATGRNYGITVLELGGDGRTASANGDRKYVTASTYKLFVAYMVLKDLENGGLKWEDVIVDGLNVHQCFEEMIVRSANRCAIAYIGRYGANAIVSKMHELGFASVEHNSTWWATPNDLAQYMSRLERGELLSGESREFLLSLLKRQIWRYGIPTGIKGVAIADKVGFLEDYIHDAAVVYSPKGTYILVVMTKGGSYGGIADAARRVHSYMMQ